MIRGFTHYGHQKMSDEDLELSNEQRIRCQRFICIVGGLSGLQWQAFVPSLSLLVTEGMGQNIDAVGQMYAAFISASVIGFLTLPFIVDCKLPTSKSLLTHLVRPSSRRILSLRAQPPTVLPAL